MRIAISTDEGRVSPHFGRCPQFTIVDIENGSVVKTEVVDNPGHSFGFLPKFLHESNVEVIVSLGMGHNAQNFFNELGIQVITGASGNVTDIIEKLLKGSLESKESVCNHGDGKGYGIDKVECNHVHSS